jgi:hypothetical protein
MYSTRCTAAQVESLAYSTVLHESLALDGATDSCTLFYCLLLMRILQCCTACISGRVPSQHH